MSTRRPQRPTDEEIVSALLNAYRQGAFPMADPRTGRIGFYSPDPRGILPLTRDAGLHIPRRLIRRAKQQPFELRCDTAFEAVIRGCAQPRRRHPHHDADDDTWISDTIIDWYCTLHRAGHAHSIEAWATDPITHESALVGGVYGVSIGAAFFGESMFFNPQPRRADGSRHPLDGTDASKLCLIALADHLTACGYTLFDTQMVTDHVARFGGREILRDEYLDLLTLAIDQPPRWRPFSAPSST